MATFIITRDTNSVTINSYIDEQPGFYQLSVEPLNNILIIKADDGGFKGEIHTLTDTITVNGEAFEGTAQELKDLLYSDVLTVASSGSGGSGGGGILKVVKTLTNNETKALPTTPIQIIEPPGAGKRLHLFHCVVKADNNAGVYSNVNASSAWLGLYYSTGSSWEERASELIENRTNTMGELVQLTNLLTTVNNNKLTILQPYRNVLWSNAFSTNNSFLSIPDYMYLPGMDNIGFYLLADNNGDGNYTGGDAANTLKVTVYYSIEDI